jgi:type II secretory pathway pseudopilin PulG
MKTRHFDNRIRSSKCVGGRIAQRRVGFTLVEMMVTLGIMMLLFGIIFVPLNQAFNFFQLGQTRTSMQQAARQSLEQISSDLRTAVRVFPNDLIPGITNQPPYNNDAPYILQGQACSVANNTTTPEVERPANLSRVDFIPAEVSNGSVVTPVRAGKHLVTYYARRLNAAEGYEPIVNPVLLFRAQSPIRDENGTFTADGTSTGPHNVDTRNTRYTALECTPRGSLWLYQNSLGEPIGLATTAYQEPDSGTVAASDVRAIPLGVSLSVPNPATSLTPLTTFTLSDSNSDGKIDQVKINLSLESYNTSSTSNGSGEIPKPQAVRMSTTVDLPNVM